MSNVNADELIRTLDASLGQLAVASATFSADLSRATESITRLRDSLSRGSGGGTVTKLPSPGLTGRLRDIWTWLHSTGRWTRSLTLLGIAFAIAFGVFAPMSWILSRDSNRLAELGNAYGHQGVQISAFEHALSVYSNDLAKYSNDLSVVANKYAQQSRDDGRLSNRLAYISICLSNSTFFPKLCTRITDGSAAFQDSFATDFNYSFPPDPTGQEVPLEEPPPDPSRNPPPRDLPRDLLEEPRLKVGLSSFRFYYAKPAIVGVTIILPFSIFILFLAA